MSTEGNQPCEGDTRVEEVDSKPALLHAKSTYRVLLADDETLVRRWVQRILDRAGWDTVSVANGQEALDAWPPDGEPFDLVILDVVMPVLDGFQTYLCLREQHPRARVLFISGYIHDELWQKLDRTCMPPLLNKPFSADDLLLLARQLLEDAQTD